MAGWARGLAALAVAVVATAAFTVSAGAATSCGIVSAAGHKWILVATGVPCSTAKRFPQRLGARTAALHAGASATVRSPVSGGFVCVLSSHGKPGGSCATAGAHKQVLWIAAA